MGGGRTPYEPPMRYQFWKFMSEVSCACDCVHTSYPLNEYTAAEEKGGFKSAQTLQPMY